VTDLYRDIRNEPPLYGWFAGILVVTAVGSVVFAAVSYLTVERPALELKDKRRRLFPSWRPVGLPAGADATAPTPAEADEATPSPEVRTA
jgi:peptidoglycan/LPS O-acetylase OafA/YrhL